MFGNLLLLFLLIIIISMSFLWITLQNIHGFICSKINFMSLMFFNSFNLLLNVTFIQRFKPSICMEVAKPLVLAISSLELEYNTSNPVLILLNMLVQLSANIFILLKMLLLCFIMLSGHSNIGPQPLKLQFISSTECLLRLHVTNLLIDTNDAQLIKTYLIRKFALSKFRHQSFVQNPTFQGIRPKISPKKL